MCQGYAFYIHGCLTNTVERNAAPMPTGCFYGVATCSPRDPHGQNQLAILVGPTKAIEISIKRVTDRQCYTALADRLRNSSISIANINSHKV
jgi:hypothetical protein